LFEPFRRLSADRMSHTEGAGLGLTIARSIAQAHFGAITAKPFHDGGLDVVVHLPAG
jgi:signal transduction histidine kinase